MKPEIKAMLPEMPGVLTKPDGSHYYTKADIDYWLEKLTEGARVVYGDNNDDRLWDEDKDSRYLCTALLICPREIKKQTPLEIAKEYLELIADKMPSCDCMDAPGLAKDALAKIEAAK